MRNDWRSFEDARNFVRELKIKGYKEWTEYSKSGKKPKDIPTTPRRAYKKEWEGWGDWFGTGTVATQDRVYRSYEDAKKFVHKLKLVNRPSWEKYARSDKKPDDIPNNPWNTYKNKGWKGMGDFLGTGTLAPKDMVFWEFTKARSYVRKLKLNGKSDWEKFCRSGKRPKQIPTAPSSTYKKDWISWGDWFGTGRVQSQLIKYRSFEDAREYVHKLNIKSSEEWRNYIKSGKKPDDIPSNANNTYRNKGWVSWGDFLGTGNVHEKNFLPLKEAKIVARKLQKELGIRTRKDWINAHHAGKIPKNLPIDIYKYKGRGERNECKKQS